MHVVYVDVLPDCLQRAAECKLMYTVVEKSPTGTFATPERSQRQGFRPCRGEGPRASRRLLAKRTLKVDEVDAVLAEDGACGFDVAQQPAAENLRLG